MIIILSSKYDYTTYEVTNWLNFFNQKYIVVSPKDLFRSIEVIDFNRFNFKKNIEKILGCKLKEIKVIWCRKWYLIEALDDLNIDNSEIRNSLLSEIEVINKMFFEILPKKRIINNFNKRLDSKLNQLIIAQECNLNIPKSHLINSMKSIDIILNSNINLITKPMNEGVDVKFDNDEYTTYTERLKRDQINSDDFFPSLVQNEINKKYEIRTLFIGDDDYSMAINCNNLVSDVIDIRKFSENRPENTAHFILPEEYKLKILKLMKRLNLKTGSVDTLVDHKNDFFFLEINPYGQFSFISEECNFNLEYKFSQFLMNYEC